MGYALSPIAVDGLESLLTFYIPVLVLTVFLLLYLTRKRPPVKWDELYAVSKTTANKEAWLSVGYLLLTQMILGLGFDLGLHFPGTDIYSTGSHSQTPCPSNYNSFIFHYLTSIFVVRFYVECIQ